MITKEVAMVFTSNLDGLVGRMRGRLKELTTTFSNVSKEMIIMKNNSKLAFSQYQQSIAALNSSTHNLKGIAIQNKNAVSSMFTGLNAQFAGFKDVINATMPDYKEFIDSGQHFTNVGARIASRVRQLTHGMRGFRMEMLGVMFFGMMLTRTFSQMLRPALELFGVFELWTIVLQTLFLPIVAALFPYFLKLVTSLMDLSPELKIVIGLMVLLGLAMGFVLFVLGTFALGIGSIIQVGIGALIGFFGIFLVVFLGLGIILYSFIKIFKGDFQYIGVALMALGAILLAFGLWWAWIPIVVGLVVALLIAKWDSFKTFFEKLWNSIKITFFESILDLYNKINELITKLKSLPGVWGLPFQGLTTIDTTGLENTLGLLKDTSRVLNGLPPLKESALGVVMSDLLGKSPIFGGGFGKTVSPVSQNTALGMIGSDVVANQATPSVDQTKLDKTLADMTKQKEGLADQTFLEGLDNFELVKGGKGLGDMNLVDELDSNKQLSDIKSLLEQDQNKNEINITQENNVQVIDKAELERFFDEKLKEIADVVNTSTGE